MVVSFLRVLEVELFVMMWPVARYVSKEAELEVNRAAMENNMLVAVRLSGDVVEKDV